MRKSSKGGKLSCSFHPLSLYSLYSLELQRQYPRGFAGRLRGTSNTIKPTSNTIKPTSNTKIAVNMSLEWCFLNLPLRLPLYKKRPTKVVQSRRRNPINRGHLWRFYCFPPFLNQCNCPLFLFMSRTSGTFVPLCRFVPLPWQFFANPFYVYTKYPQ